MKRAILLIMLILAVAQFTWADGVVMATDSDLAAFDSLVRQEHSRKDSATLRRETQPSAKSGSAITSFGTSVKEEAAKLKNEGASGGSQNSKWIVEQRKAKRADDQGSDARANQHIRENANGGGNGKKQD